MKALPLAIAALLLALAACSSPSPPCERIAYDNPHALNVVFLQDGFTDAHAEELARGILAALAQKEPWRSHGSINAYLVRNDDPSLCVEGRAGPLIGGYGPDPLPPLQCDVANVTRLVGSCGVARAKIVVMTNDSVASQAGVSFAEPAVMFLDMRGMPPEIVQHEFAHLFGLVDESARIVSYADGPGRRAAPNCVATLEEAKARWGRLYPDGYAFPQGCAGEAAWYKPEEQTLMGRLPDPSYGYGAFDSWYLGTAMDCCYSPSPDPQACGAFFRDYPEWAGCRT